MFDNPKERAAAEDAFARVDDNIPLDHELQAMSYVELASLLSSCEKGSAKYLVVERAKMHRDTFESQILSQAIPKGKANPVPDHWYKKPIAVIGITVFGGVVLASAIYLIRQHLGVL